MFVGNKHLVEDFKNLIKGDKLSHGYIFFGEPQVGKLAFSKCLVNFLENGEFDIPQRILSDSMVFNEKGKQAGIDTIRDLKRFSFQRPIVSKRKTIIIDEAEKLTPEAQNAILKIAEEPSSSVLLILITTNLNNLLLPLLSRLQKIYFGRVSDNEIIDFLIKNYKINKARAEELTEVSCGRIGRAVDLLNDKVLVEAREMADKFLKLTSFARSKLIKRVIEIQKDSPEFLDYFMEFLIVNLRRDPIKNLKLLKSCLNRLFLMKAFNTNKRLQLEAIIG